MPKQAISVTLDTQNLTWLKGQVGANRGRSISDLLDRIVTNARTSGRGGASRSVVGTIDIEADDPMLQGADAAVRGLFERSLGRPLAVRERRASYRSRGGASTRRG